MKNRYISLRLSEEFSGELNDALEIMETSLGVPCSKGFKVRMLLHMGIERLRTEGLLSKI